MKKYSDLKLESIRLRQQGLSYLNISRKLKVSKSCVRNWTRGIQLTLSQMETIKKNHIISASDRLKKIQDDKAKITKATRSDLDMKGVLDIQNISDPLFFLGLGLYWGEGYKNKTQEIGIVNTDPKILRTSMAWFEKYYGVLRSEYSARLSLNEEYKEIESSVIDFWLAELGLTKEQFTKTSFIKTKHKRTYHDTTYRGTLRIKVPKPLRLHNRILSSINNLQNYTK